MGAKGAIPAVWAKVHPTFQTPTNATIWMGILSVAFYVGLKLVSENIYWDALAALGLMIAFYYGLTGYAAAIYYRHWLLRSAKNFFLMGVVPVFGGVFLTWAFVKSAVDLADPANSYSGVDWFGVSVPLAITSGVVRPGPGADGDLVDQVARVLPQSPGGALGRRSRAICRDGYPVGRDGCHRLLTSWGQSGASPVLTGAGLRPPAAPIQR